MRDGAWIVGGNPKGDRIKDDWYATNPEAVRMLLDTYSKFNMKNILEPCVGEGHIANVLKEYSGQDVTCIDIIDRGYKDTIVTDFLTWNCDKEYDTIITNPPYKLAIDFIKKCISILSQNGQLAMFLKIQFLEGLKEKNYLIIIRQNISMCLEGGCRYLMKELKSILKLEENGVVYYVMHGIFGIKNAILSQLLDGLINERI